MCGHEFTLFDLLSQRMRTIDQTYVESDLLRNAKEAINLLS